MFPRDATTTSLGGGRRRKDSRLLRRGRRSGPARPGGLTRSGAGLAVAGHPLTAQGPALLLGGAAPDATVLVGDQRVLQASRLHVAGLAHGLGVGDLLDGRTGGADGEE